MIEVQPRRIFRRRVLYELEIEVDQVRERAWRESRRVAA